MKTAKKVLQGKINRFQFETTQKLEGIKSQNNKKLAEMKSRMSINAFKYYSQSLLQENSLIENELQRREENMQEL